MFEIGRKLLRSSGDKGDFFVNFLEKAGEIDKICNDCTKFIVPKEKL